MKYPLLPILLMVLLFTKDLDAQDKTSSQDKTEVIEMKNTLLGYRFYQNGERLLWKDLEERTKSVEHANLLIKKAKTQNRWSSVTAFASGALLGIPLGQQAADRDPNWEFAYASGALAIVGIHLTFRAFNNVNKGIDEYNLAINPAAYQFNPEFKIISNGASLGLAMKF
ncbi:MAG: hypothetical protein AAF039_13095 [Bacteroidota bacterium]